jgi:hypothetical protein
MHHGMEAVCHNPSLEEVVARLGLGEVGRKAMWDAALAETVAPTLDPAGDPIYYVKQRSVALPHLKHICLGNLSANSRQFLLRVFPDRDSFLFVPR